MKIPIAATVLLSVIASLGRSEPAWEISNPRPLSGEIISIDQPAVDTVWAANDGGMLVRSTDNGKTWDVIDLPVSINGKLIIDFTNGSKGFVVAINNSETPFGALVFRTLNGGNDWIQWEIGNQDSPFGATCVKVFGETVLIGGIYPGNPDRAVVYRLNNNAWIESFLPGDDVRALNGMWLLNSNMAWVVGDNGYVASTSDGGRNWQQIPTRLESDLYCVYFSSPTTGWAGGGTFNTASLFKTTNGGTVWQSIDGLSAYSKFIDLNPFGGSGIVAASRGGGDPDTARLFLSTDGRDWVPGSSWVNTFLTDINVFNDNIWISGMNGLIAKSVDGAPAEQVSTSCTTNDLLDVSFATGAVGWAVGELGTVIRTFDGGYSWSAIENFPYYEPIAVLAVTPWRVIVCCRGSLELITTNGGDSWREIDISEANVTELDHSGESIYAVAGNSVSVSNDNGAHWVSSIVREDGVILSLAVVNDRTAFVALQRDSVFVTFDSGQHWTASLTIPPRTRALSFIDGNISRAAVETQNGSSIYATEDGWLHRQQIHSLGYYVNDLKYFSVDNGYVLGDGGQFQFLRRGNAAGLTSGLRTANVVNRIESLGNWIWVCGEGGLIARWGENWLGVTDESSDQRPETSKLAYLYPNPTNGSVSILLNNDRGGRIQIFGMDGREAVSFDYSGGISVVHIDLKELPAGVYLVSEREGYFSPKTLLLLK